MKIDKVINNNLIRAFDKNNKEVLVMGCGLGFKKKIGEEIDSDKIEKVYYLEDANSTNKLVSLLSEIPLEVIQACNEIISYAKYSLGKKINDNIYISLTDHINFALERAKQGVDFKNALIWEIKRFYNHEFLIGKEALQIIKKKLNVELPEDEAASIAINISSPGLYPAFVIASRITSIASALLFKFGANPPSSPIAVEYPFSCNVFFNV